MTTKCNDKVIEFTAVAKNQEDMNKFVSYLQKAYSLYNKEIIADNTEVYFKANPAVTKKCLLSKRIMETAKGLNISFKGSSIVHDGVQYDKNQELWQKRKAARDAIRQAKNKKVVTPAVKQVVKPVRVPSKSRRKWSFMERMYRAYRILTGAVGK